MTSALERQLRVQVSVPAVSDLTVREPAKGAPSRLILLLHGYEESGERIFRKLEPALDRFFDDALIVAPNGPFPIPRRASMPSEGAEKTGPRYSVGFSWYFYDFVTDEYYIDMAIAIEFLRGIVSKVGAEALPKTLIGFSQGGYLAPFAAAALPGTRQVIGIGARYLDEELPAGAPVFRCDSIHGTEDDRVSFSDSMRSHQNLLARGGRGAFRALQGGGHRIDEAVRLAVRELLSEEESRT